MSISSSPLFPGLPRPVRAVLRLGARMVPPARRRDWVREWNGELDWFRLHDSPAPISLLGRSLGCLPDAFWIRTHEWSPEMLLQDIKFALRAHLKRPGFAAVALLTLAIGIGATSAVFSIVDGVLIDPLPYEEPGRLVRLYGFNEERGTSRINVNPMDMVDVRDRSRTLEGVAWSTSDSVTLTEFDEPMRLRADYVAAAYFDVLGARPALGRFFVPAEDDSESPRMLVLSYSTWDRLFAADPDAIGRTISLSGTPHTIIGVAQPGLRDPFSAEPPAFWMTWPFDATNPNRGGHFLRAFARMAPGATLEATRNDVAAIAAQIAQEHDKGGRGIEAVPLKEAVAGEARPVLMLLLGAVAFVLLIVCANLAGLFLARSAGRQRELAARIALGASRGRILRQLLSECLLLSLGGGALGVVLGSLFVGAVGEQVTSLVATGPTIGLDWRVLLFSAGVSLTAGVLFGIVPAIQATRRDPRGLLDVYAASGGGRGTFRSGLVVAQVTLSLVLLVGAGLLTRSLGNLLSLDTGYDPEGVVTARLDAPEDAYPEYSDVTGFYERLLGATSATPDLTVAGAINRLPLGGSYSCDWFHLEGWEPTGPGDSLCAEERVVGGDYFEAMGIRLIEGRWFDQRDGADGEPVVVISRTMAERHFADREPIGSGFKWGPHDERPYRRVIGIVEDVRHVSLEAEPMPEVYMPQAQYPYYRTMYVVGRTGGEAAAAISSLRSALARVDPTIPLFDVATMADRLGESVLLRGVVTAALAAFAAVALLLAAIGLYGVLAYTVSQRTREIGIRMALGATGPSVTAMVLRRGLILAVIGVAIGSAAWLGVSRMVATLLYGVDVIDPATLALTAAGLLAVAGVASWLPALRATRVDPVVALRE